MKINANLKQKSGIYCICNTITDKKYVGSSINIYDRLSRHRSALRGNYHNNSYLQNSWNKYKENSFICFVLEFCKEESLTEREFFYIEQFGEYNITKDCIRNKPSEESKKKHSNTKKKLHELGLLVKTCNPITQYDLNGNFIKEWDSITNACKELKIHPSTIIRNLQGIYKKGKNYLWTYKGDRIPSPYIRTKKEINSNSRSRKVIFKDNDEIIVFDSIKLAAKFFNIFPESIYQYYNKKIKFKGKYIIDLVKSDKLLETPINKDNQQPIITLNE